MASTEMGMGEGTLKKAAQLVSGAKQDFDRMSGELDGQIAGLRGQWAGAGGQAFFVLHQAWTEKQRVVVSALDEFEAALLGTERDITSTDDTQASNFTNFQSKLS
jgi:WXG100 family type VII secretion target